MLNKQDRPEDTPSDWPKDWLIPDWPAPAGVQAVVTSRAGGLSTGLFESMNLGDHVGDNPAAVAANRERLASHLQARPVFMQQVHGVEVARLDPVSLPLPPGEGRGEGTRTATHFDVPPLRADGALTLERGLACTVMVADCLPILLTHTRVPVVAALHAGWRGLAGQGGVGIVDAGIAQLQAATGLAHADLASGLMAWLGPCIGPTCFEVGAEVRQAFVASHPEAQACFTPSAPGKFLADLSGLARLRLQAQGVRQIYGNDGSTSWCTVTQDSRFFSHRRVAGRLGAQAGDTGGRFAACIWLA